VAPEPRGDVQINSVVCTLKMRTICTPPRRDLVLTSVLLAVQSPPTTPLCLQFGVAACLLLVARCPPPPSYPHLKHPAERRDPCQRDPRKAQPRVVRSTRPREPGEDASWEMVQPSLPKSKHVPDVTLMDKAREPHCDPATHHPCSAALMLSSSHVPASAALP
jgi:hypothetical protein